MVSRAGGRLLGSAGFVGRVGFRGYMPTPRYNRSKHLQNISMYDEILPRFRGCTWVVDNDFEGNKNIKSLACWPISFLTSCTGLLSPCLPNPKKKKKTLKFIQKFNLISA